MDLLTSLPFIAVFISSLMGGAHCLGMCGGLVAASTQDVGSQISYHVSRLVAYLILGATAGLIGETFLSEMHPKIGGIGAMVIGALFLGVGAALVISPTRRFHLQLPKISQLLSKIAASRPRVGPNLYAGLVGFSSGFLPCGWLYTIVVSTLALQSVVGSMLMLTIFWVGTLPFVTVGPYLAKRLAQTYAINLPRLSGLTFIAFGLFMLLHRTH